MSPENRPIYNADRKHALRHVEAALADGRIDVEDFEELSQAITEAESHDVLDDIIDRSRRLSTTGVQANGHSQEVAATMGGAVDTTNSESKTSWFSNIERKGNWTVNDGSAYETIFGEIILDMREATAAQAEVTLRTHAFAGNICVIVSPGVEVINQIETVMSEVKDNLEPGVPGAARIILTGRCIMGTIKLLSRHAGERLPFGFKSM